MSRAKEILITAINKYLRIRLEQLGLKFVESSLKFNKSINGFRNEVLFIGRKTNWLDEFVNFDLQYRIWKPAYKSWIKKELGIKKTRVTGLIQGNRSSLDLYDKHNQFKLTYDFVKQDHETIMNSIFENIKHSGLKHFKDNDTNRKVADGSTGIERIDFYLMDKEFDQARGYIYDIMNGIDEETLKKYPQLQETKNDCIVRLNYIEKFDSWH